MITFDNVTKKFPVGTTGLNGVSFEINTNEFIYLVGPSGAGKTTILKLLLREYRPTSGSIIVDETDIASKRFNNIPGLRKKIGVVFQDFKILESKKRRMNSSKKIKT
jgi:cell division transport system ATP-binding protein